MTAIEWKGLLSSVRKDGSSIGALVEVVAENFPPGLGAPLYGKLDADLASGLMGINGVKAVEIGEGFGVATLRGEDNADPMRMHDGVLHFEGNRAGGILGGISTGQPITARFAIKPTSSILVPVPSVNRQGENIDVITKVATIRASASVPCLWPRRWSPVFWSIISCVITRKTAGIAAATESSLMATFRKVAIAPCQARVVVKVISALKSCDTGQPFFALVASSSNFA